MYKISILIKTTAACFTKNVKRLYQPQQLESSRKIQTRILTSAQRFGKFEIIMEIFPYNAQ